VVKRNWRKLTSRTGRHFGRALLGISAACTVGEEGLDLTRSIGAKRSQIMKHVS